jgi:hypothetical protein
MTQEKQKLRHLPKIIAHISVCEPNDPTATQVWRLPKSFALDDKPTTFVGWFLR